MTHLISELKSLSVRFFGQQQPDQERPDQGRSDSVIGGEVIQMDDGEGAFSVIMLEEGMTHSVLNKLTLNQLNEIFKGGNATTQTLVRATLEQWIEPFFYELFWKEAGPEELIHFISQDATLIQPRYYPFHPRTQKLIEQLREKAGKASDKSAFLLKAACQHLLTAKVILNDFELWGSIQAKSDNFAKDLLKIIENHPQLSSIVLKDTVFCEILSNYCKDEWIRVHHNVWKHGTRTITEEEEGELLETFISMGEKGNFDLLLKVLAGIDRYMYSSGSVNQYIRMIQRWGQKHFKFAKIILNDPLRIKQLKEYDEDKSCLALSAIAKSSPQIAWEIWQNHRQYIVSHSYVGHYLTQMAEAHPDIALEVWEDVELRQKILTTDESNWIVSSYYTEDDKVESLLRLAKVFPIEEKKSEILSHIYSSQELEELSDDWEEISQLLKIAEVGPSIAITLWPRFKEGFLACLFMGKAYQESPFQKNELPESFSLEDQVKKLITFIKLHPVIARDVLDNPGLKEYVRCSWDQEKQKIAAELLIAIAQTRPDLANQVWRTKECYDCLTNPLFGNRYLFALFPTREDIIMSWLRKGEFYYLLLKSNSIDALNALTLAAQRLPREMLQVQKPFRDKILNSPLSFNYLESVAKSNRDNFDFIVNDKILFCHLLNHPQLVKVMCVLGRAYNIQPLQELGRDAQENQKLLSDFLKSRVQPNVGLEDYEIVRPSARRSANSC